MKTIPFLFLLVLSLSCFAQNKELKNELGLNMYGLEIDVDNFGDGLYQPYYFNGLQYKRQVGKQYKLRASGQYFSRAENGSTNSVIYASSVATYPYSWSYITSVYEVRSGIERSFFASAKLTPFVFADVAYRYSHDKGTSRSHGWPNGESVYQVDYKEHYLGGIFGLGVKYRPIPSLYVGVETSICKYWQTPFVNPYSETYYSPIKTLVFGVQF